MRQLILLASAGIVLFDAIASAVSLSTGVPYGFFALGSLAIYVIVGWKAYHHTGSLRTATLATMAVGLVEGTLGWYVSWLIGPGRPAEGEPTGAFMLVAGVLATLVGAVIGAQIGGRLARRSARRSAASS